MDAVKLTSQNFVYDLRYLFHILFFFAASSLGGSAKANAGWIDRTSCLTGYGIFVNDYPRPFQSFTSFFTTNPLAIHPSVYQNQVTVCSTGHNPPSKFLQLIRQGHGIFYYLTSIF